ncbi:cytochrome c [Paralimibaculum aggregatum]|uniref:Cytochrome c n=1 Tax=Paralimibaculum aggregatum TaxID=3036245 RepID=A0ABQ6LKQ0_9RHOB|nr:hypothetical protein [Limibaculum sp. NKW23]GMG81368.1 cytochrome c [Limibaculum sp. NKW23]
MPVLRHIAPALALAATVAAPALAAEIDGAHEYAVRCAICHGLEGRGDGPYELYLKVKPADLTVLAIDNRGRFPFEDIYRVIDGRTELLAHGPREMPIWGYEYRRLENRQSDADRGGASAETVVSQKILALIEHIRAMQRAE